MSRMRRRTGYQDGGEVSGAPSTASPFVGGGTADQFASTGAMPHYPVPNAVLMSMSLDKRAGDPSTWNADQAARSTRPKPSPVVPPQARFKKGGPVRKTGYQEGGGVEEDDDEETEAPAEETDDTDEEERRREEEPETTAEQAPEERGGEEEAAGGEESAAPAVEAEEEQETERGGGGGAEGAREGGAGGAQAPVDQEEATALAPSQVAAREQLPPAGGQGEEVLATARRQALLDTRPTGYAPGQGQAQTDPSTDNLRQVLEYTRNVFGLGGGQRQPLAEGQAEGPSPVATAAGSGRLPMPPGQEQAPSAAPPAATAQTGYGQGQASPAARIGGQQIRTGYGGAQARPAQAQAPPPAAAPPDAQQGLAAYMEGQRAFSPDEMTRLLDHGVGLEHQGDMGTAIHKTFDDLVSAGNTDAASRMLQALRPSYDSLRAVMMAAVGQGQWDKAMQLAEKLNDLLPNGRSLDMSRTSDGNFTAIVHPSARGGHVTSFSLTPQQFAQYANGPASLMDVQGSKGLENTLAALTGAPGAQGTRGGFAPTNYPGTAGQLAGGTDQAQAEAARQVGQGVDPTEAARQRLQARQPPATQAAPVTPGGTAADYARTGVYTPGGVNAGQNWWNQTGRPGQPAPGTTPDPRQLTAPAPRAASAAPPAAPVPARAQPAPAAPAGGQPGGQAPRTPPAPVTQDQSGQPLYPHTITYTGRDGRPTGRYSVRLSPVPTRPDDPQYVPQPTGPHLNSGDPNAGPGHYDQNGLWTGFSGVPGLEHPMSYERTMARNIAIARMFPDEYGPMLTGGGGSQHSSTSRYGGSQGTSIGATRLQQMGINPANARAKMLNDEMAQFNARMHDYTTQQSAQGIAGMKDIGETYRAGQKDTGETYRETIRQQRLADKSIIDYYTRNPPQDPKGPEAKALAAAIARQAGYGQSAEGYNPNRLLMGEPPTGPVRQIVPRPGAPDLTVYRGTEPPQQHYELPPDYTWYSHPSDKPENTRWEALPRAPAGQTYNFDTNTGRPVLVPKPAAPAPAAPAAPAPSTYEQYQDWLRRGGVMQYLPQGYRPGDQMGPRQPPPGP